MSALNWLKLLGRTKRGLVPLEGRLASSGATTALAVRPEGDPAWCLWLTPAPEDAPPPPKRSLTVHDQLLASIDAACDWRPIHAPSLATKLAEVRKEDDFFDGLSGETAVVAGVVCSPQTLLTLLGAIPVDTIEVAAARGNWVPRTKNGQPISHPGSPDGLVWRWPGCHLLIARATAYTTPVEVTL